MTFYAQCRFFIIMPSVMALLIWMVWIRLRIEYKITGYGVYSKGPYLYNTVEETNRSQSFCLLKVFFQWKITSDAAFRPATTSPTPLPFRDSRERTGHKFWQNTSEIQTGSRSHGTRFYLEELLFFCLSETTSNFVSFWNYF
jgi:hypothetical protein